MSDQPLEKPVVIDGIWFVRGHSISTHQADDGVFFCRLRQKNVRSFALAMGQIGAKSLSSIPLSRV